MLSVVKVKELSKLMLDLGKIVFAAAVLGFLIPGFSGNVSVSGFLFGSFSAIFLFVIGINLVE